jgi:hypothetical protein
MRLGFGRKMATKRANFPFSRKGFGDITAAGARKWELAFFLAPVGDTDVACFYYFCGEIFEPIL